MIRNTGSLPAKAVGKRVNVILANGYRAADWAADGRWGCRWSLTGSPFDIDFYEVIA